MSGGPLPAPAGPALLLVAPGEPVSIPPGTPLLGLPLVRRTALAARRAGFGDVFWEGSSDGDALGAVLAGAAAIGFGPRDAVRLPWNRVVTVADLRALRENGDVGPAPAVRAPEDLLAAERYLLESLVKQTDSPLARLVNRRISLFVSRLLAPTGVTPNAMTLVCAAIGLLGAASFLSLTRERQLAGGLLFLLHSILDGCDGELARLKLLESRLGGVLDYWGDNVVHAAVFAGIAVGWSREAGEAWPLALGALAILGSLAAAGFVFRSTMTEARPAGTPLFVSVTKAPATGVSRVADLLARRDFIYFVLILCAAGKVQWFLVLAAIGAPAYVLVLLAMAWGGRRAERKLT